MKATAQKISFLYLIAVPVLVTALAFVIGHVDYKIYLPFWVLNACLMVFATLKLNINLDLNRQSPLWFFVIPWMLMSIFGGMGPPPETPAAWAALALEENVRYLILIASGVLMTIGFIRFKNLLARKPGKKYAFYGQLMMCIALPLFMMNMVYWGYFLTNVFVEYAQPGAPEKPEWHKSLSSLFVFIRMIEVGLFYFATASLALSLFQSKLLSKSSAILYIGIACTAALLNLLPPSISGPLAILNYLSYIPAYTMLMPYLITVNLFSKPAINDIMLLSSDKQPSI